MLYLWKRKRNQIRTEGGIRTCCVGTYVRRSIYFNGYFYFTLLIFATQFRTHYWRSSKGAQELATDKSYRSTTLFFSSGRLSCFVFVLDRFFLRLRNTCIASEDNSKNSPSRERDWNLTSPGRTQTQNEPVKACGERVPCSGRHGVKCSHTLRLQPNYFPWCVFIGNTCRSAHSNKCREVLRGRARTTNYQNRKCNEKMWTS